MLDRLEDAEHEAAKRRPARQIVAPEVNVHGREHELGIAVGDKTADLLDHLAGGHRARIAPAIRNDAEGAAVITAILNLDKGAGAFGEAVEHVNGGLAHRHYI